MADTDSDSIQAHDLTQSLARAAHALVDRLAAIAEPTVTTAGAKAQDATQKLREHGSQLDQIRQRSVENLRSRVRERPLSALVLALSVGVLMGFLASRSD